MDELGILTITTIDVETGKQLQFSYDPETQNYKINGTDVMRKWFLESDTNVYIFGASALKEYHRINRQEFERLMALSDIPRHTTS